MTKVTMTLDDEAIRQLELTAKRLRQPKSEVTRRALVEFAQRSERPSEAEIARKLAVIDAMMRRPASRPEVEVISELAEIRERRRSGWRDPQ
jgi:predicted transcriptional regulator